ncbi:MAG: 3-phosphoglycerate dehydrogenase [Bacteroidetes bacterium]|nr:MAG: 3-phosphoglycerate dehydrogenase [Bacteroidota bacterium]MBL1143970.1 3-phosphoglycerate dehydrogenase [Bacteroidota bacterium]NOG56771.1 D-2-hydroxyacid dehydrogenase [Bacteroidota bacterium]
MKVLANDGIAASGKVALENEGFTVVTETVAQENLIDAINKENYEVLLVRSATTVRKDLIDACPNLKMIGRGGVGMDNIDVEYARSKGIEVINTPASSSQSVAELVMAHLFGAVRFLYDANREMPVNGATDFKVLKKKYAKGIELRGKTMGIIGFGRIGQALAQYALGCGMNVIAHDAFGGDNYQIKLHIAGNDFSIPIKNQSMESVIKNADFLSFHIPGGSEAVIGAKELAKMKNGVVIANAARGGVIDESALIDALNSGKVAHAALDVFVGEPNPNADLLKHPKLSLTPHIGAATVEAQDRIGTELAAQIIAFYEKVNA